MLRRCGRCGEEKPLDEFAWRRKARGQRDNYCRPCRAAYKQEHYAANRDRYIENASRRKRKVAQENTARLFEFFGLHPCVDCGECDPLVLEFDHLDTKSFGIARATRDRSWAAIRQELLKCEVVCANCHRRRTAKRGGWVRVATMEQVQSDVTIEAAKTRARRLASCKGTRV